LSGTDSQTPIVQYWDSGEPPREIADLLAGFGERNPGRRHLVFDQDQAAELIAAHFGERELTAFRACAVPAMRADYFRYCAILALGGIYADAGFRCLAPLQPLFDSPEQGALFRVEPRGYLLNGAFLFRTPGHPLLRLALDLATTNIERRPVEMVQMVTGPWVFTALWVLHRLNSDEAVAPHGLADALRLTVEPLVPTAAARQGIEPMIEPLFEAVGDLGRLAQAFQGVRIAPFDALADRIAQPDEPLLYKEKETYWINWQRRGRSIFR
jgi:hypothetical protein